MHNVEAKKQSGAVKRPKIGVCQKIVLLGVTLGTWSSSVDQLFEENPRKGKNKGTYMALEPTDLG